jgi:hypothetical protein
LFDVRVQESGEELGAVEDFKTFLLDLFWG